MTLPVNPRASAPTGRWVAAIEDLRGLAVVPAALASLWLLEQGRTKWASVVVAHTSMHDLIFSRLGDPYPWQVEVLVSWEVGVYEFRLLEGQGGILISADRCFERNAPAVLDAFLYQLAEPLAPDAVGEEGQPQP